MASNFDIHFGGLDKITSSDGGDPQGILAHAGDSLGLGEWAAGPEWDAQG